MIRTAALIAPDRDFDGAPLLRGEFGLAQGHGPVARATLRLSARGVVEAWVNGARASEDLLTPGWTSYEWRTRYAETDVTDLVGATTVIGLALGNGWYRGRLGWVGTERLYGEELAGFARLHVVFQDGQEQIVGTDATWTSGPSATTANDLYGGQEIDARRFDRSWLHPGFSSDEWVGVHALNVDPDLLQPYIGPPVRRQEEVPPTAVTISPSGKVIVDFGQNLVGWIRASLMGPTGSTVTVRHAEVLENGEIATRPLRTAEATDRFTLSGGDDVFEPTLVFHGFRYAEVSGWPGGADAILTGDGLRAVVIGSDLRRIGRFESSDPLLNRFHTNAVWGMRGNFVDVPTDCPQRDERLGWTGDIAAFAPTAAFLFDVGDFLRDWLVDLALEQEHNGGDVPVIVPDVMKYFDVPAGTFPEVTSTALWSDAAVWVPWALWTAYGDRAVLEQQYSSVTMHVRRVAGLLSDEGIWDTGFQFGDWLDPDAPPEAPDRAKADPHVVATLCAFRTARLAARIADEMGEASDEREFAELAERIGSGFTSHYLHNGVITSDCATVYALAIVFEILDEHDLVLAGDRLASLVRESGHRISTGFAGTPFVTDALTRTGHLEDAYGLLLQTQCPSWLYPVTMGATTIWERWDSMLPDGSINPGEMTSFNHYALGAVADWMHRTIGGIIPLSPGYRRTLIAPQPGGGLTWARTSLETPHGHIAVGWERRDDELHLDITVPPGIDAVLRLRDRPETTLETGANAIRVANHFARVA